MVTSKTEITLTITPKSIDVPVGDGGVAWTLQVEDTATGFIEDTVTTSNLYATFNLSDGSYTGKGYRVNSIGGVVGDVAEINFTITTTTESVQAADTIGQT